MQHAVAEAGLRGAGVTRRGHEGLGQHGGRTGDAARWAGVKARLEQQLNDATVFSGVIMGYYQELSGLSI